MKTEESDEVATLPDVIWSELSEKDRTEIAVRQAVYLEVSRKFIHSHASYGSDVKNLIVTMLMILLLNFFDVENKNIILTIVFSQMLFTIFSKLALNDVNRQLENMKKSYLDFIKSKKQKNA